MSMWEFKVSGKNFRHMLEGSVVERGAMEPLGKDASLLRSSRGGGDVGKADYALPIAVDRVKRAIR